MSVRFAAAFRFLCVALVLRSAVIAWGSAYNAQPKLVVIIIIDQFRGDYLERARAQLTEGGFRLLMDRGAYFNDCNYDYANTVTAPGHATLLTGTYTNDHGIMANEWWDPVGKRSISSVSDKNVNLLGAPGEGASPHNLQSSTLGDELKLATQGKSRVFAISLKDRAAILSGGFASNAAYWIDKRSGLWVSSSYYMKDLPAWVQGFNAGKRADKYWNLEWKDSSGKLLGSTARPAAGGSFYDIVGATPFANDYELEFARELLTQEKMGEGPSTDLLIISLSASDLVGHRLGPESPAGRAMALALDHQLADFFGYLGRQFGLADTWIVLTSDHGAAPTPSYSNRLRIPGRRYPEPQLRKQINAELAARFSPGKSADYVPFMYWPQVFLDENVFRAANIGETQAESAVGEVLKKLGARGYHTRTQLSRGEVVLDRIGRKYLHSYSSLPSWYVLAVPAPFEISTITDPATHGAPYTYDTHVPLAFFGLPFQPGVYRTPCEPVDMAVTLASLLGINAPTHAVGRVLTEAVAERPSAGGQR